MYTSNTIVISLKRVKINLTEKKDWVENVAQFFDPFNLFAKE